jgi:hypothetical protein
MAERRRKTQERRSFFQLCLQRMLAVVHWASGCRSLGICSQAVESDQCFGQQPKFRALSLLWSAIKALSLICLLLGD